MIQINQRVLTPSNLVTPEKVSRPKHRECQRECQINNNEGKTQRIMNTTVSNQLANVETIRYIDEKVETYKAQLIRRMPELMAVQGIRTVYVRKRLVWCDEVSGVVYIISCKEYLCVEAENVGD